MQMKSGLIPAIITAIFLTSSILLAAEDGGAQSMIDASLVLHYSFDDDGFNDIMTEDASSYNRSGKLRGNARVVEDSIFEKGLKFDGDGDYIEVEHDLQCDGSFTIEMWILPESGLDIQYLALIDDGYASGGVYHRILLGDSIQNYNGRLLTQFDGNFYSDRTITWDQWNHIAYIYDDEENLETYYINGESAGSKSRDGGAGWSANSFTIGRQRNENRYRFGGMMDEIRIFNRPLKDWEIEQRFNLGNDRIYHGEVSISPVVISDLHPLDGDEVDLHAVVYNNGDGPREDLKVRFMDGEENIGHVVTIDRLRARDRVIVSSKWTAVAGTRTIKAVLLGEENIIGKTEVRVEPSNFSVNGINVKMTIPDPILEVDSDPDSATTFRFDVNFNADFSEEMENETLNVGVDDKSGKWDISVPDDMMMDSANSSVTVECWLYIPPETSSFIVPLIEITGQWGRFGSYIIQEMETILILDVSQYFRMEIDSSTFRYIVAAGDTLSIPLGIKNQGNGYDEITFELEGVTPDRGYDITGDSGAESYGLDSGGESTANVLISMPEDAEEDMLFITFSVRSTRMSENGGLVEIEQITFIVDVTVDDDPAVIFIIVVIMVVILIIIISMIMFMTVALKSKAPEKTDSYSREGHTHIRTGSNVDTGTNQVQDDVPKPGMAPKPPGF